MGLLKLYVRLVGTIKVICDGHNLMLQFTAYTETMRETSLPPVESVERTNFQGSNRSCTT